MNIVDYIDKFGGFSFEQKPFTKVDGLILSQFSYLKLDGIVPSAAGKDVEDVILKDIANNQNVDELFSDERYEKNNRTLFFAMAGSERFGNIKLNYYLNLISRKWEMQFSAITCKLSEGNTIIVYRGTDESIVGWKEDFNMAYIAPIPAQIKALDYLNYVAERIDGNFSVAGHSKGGNLAVFASMKCPKKTFDRIDKIYSYDGPGFPVWTLNEEAFMNASSKLVKLVPHSSIVGMLLQNQEDYSVVEAKSFGILQHDPFNWVVEGDNFIYLDKVRELYVLQNKSISDWTQNTNPDDMRILIDQIYDIIEQVGIEDLNDLKGNYAEIIYKFTIAADSISEDKKELIRKILKSLINTFIETIKTQSSIKLADEVDKINRRNI